MIMKDLIDVKMFIIILSLFLLNYTHFVEAQVEVTSNKLHQTSLNDTMTISEVDVNTDLQNETEMTFKKEEPMESSTNSPAITSELQAKIESKMVDRIFERKSIFKSTKKKEASLLRKSSIEQSQSTLYNIELDLSSEHELNKASEIGIKNPRLGMQKVKISNKMKQELENAKLKYQVLSGVSEFLIQGDDNEALATGYRYLLWDPEPNYFLPDLNGVWLTWGVGSAPGGATVTSVEYRLWVGEEDAGQTDFYCEDYIISLSSGQHGQDYNYCKVWDQDGLQTDNDEDDDVENDYDVYLNWRTTSLFNGEDANQEWYAYVGDFIGGGDGNINYIEIRVYWEADDPDLTCPSISYQAVEVTEGDAFWIRPRVQNDGEVTAGASSVRLYLSTDNDFDTSDDYALPIQSLPSLIGGAYSDIQWDIVSFPDLGTGDYSVWFVVEVDYNDDVVESNENNTYKSTGAITVHGSELPDLTSPSISFQSTEVTEGDAYWMRPRVQNDGLATAGASSVRLYLSTDDDFDTSDDYALSVESVPSLTAGAFIDIQWDLASFPDLGTGDYSVWFVIIVDYYNEVTESNENNVYKSTTPITVHDMENFPDLTCPSITAQNSEVNEGDSFWMRPRIQNDGLATAGVSSAIMYISPFDDFDTADDYSLPIQSVPSLTAGSFVDIQWDLTSFPDLGSGDYSVWLLVEVDYYNDVAESNENNLYKRLGSITVHEAVTQKPDIHVTPTSLTIEETAGLSTQQTMEPYLPKILSVEERLKGEYDQQKFFIRFTDDLNSTQSTELMNSNGLEVIRKLKLSNNTYLVRINDQEGIQAKISRLDEIQGVLYAEPDHVISKSSTIPNDTGFDGLYGMHNTGQDGGTADADIDAPEAWDLHTGSTGIIVGITDSGIDYDHPDLEPNIWTNPGEIAGNGIDDDGNGYADDIHGWDWAYGDNDPTDFDGHGTHVAGTVGAIGDNSEGVTGVCWNVKLMALKFLNDVGSGSTSNAILALEYAVDNGAHLTNNSWGGGSYNSTLETTIANSNILFMAAAGNGGVDGIGDDIDAAPYYPASYANANVIAVASLNRNNSKAGSSNFGVSSVDLGAYGVSILSTKPSNATDIIFGLPGYGLSSTYYGIISGTSMATPQVSGLAALLLSYNSSLTWQEVKDAIMDNVDPVSALNGITVTGGKINAFNALNSISQDNDTFTIENQGNATLTINSLSDDQSWLTTSGYPATPFNLESGISQVVTCNVDWNLLSTQETGIVTINSTDPDENPVYIDVTAIPLPAEELITITYPNGGESFQSGQDVTITWNSENTSGTVSIDYSTNGGSNWQSITASTPDDGSHPWTIPDEPSTNCFIQITDTDGNPSDMSDSPFTITSGQRHFTFNPTEDYYPVIIDNVTLDGQPIGDDCEVGVFFRDDNNDPVCGGALVWPSTGMEAWGDDSQTPERDGFITGEELVFRLWCPGDQVEYGPPHNVVYTTGDGTWGNGPFAQVGLMEFRSSCDITLELVDGWNWVSINVNPFVPAVVDMWTGIDCLEILKSYTGFYIPDVYDGIGDWDHLQMYTTYLSCPETLYIEGECLDPTEPIALQANWNWVSYLPEDPSAIETALASIMEYINIVKSYEGFFIPDVYNGIGDMVPGKGYKMHLSQECMLTYPANGTLAKRPGPDKSDAIDKICRHFAEIKTTEDYQAILIQSINGNDIDLESGDEIGIYTESGLCVGGVVIKDEYPLGMMAWMDDPRTEEVEGFEPGERVAIKYWDTSEEQEYDLLITIEDGSDLFGESALTKVSLEINLGSTPVIPTVYSLAQNYPNPFNPETTIRYGLPEAGKVRLSLYSIDGQLVMELDHGFKEAGYHQVIWNGRNYNGASVSSGVYFYRMEAEKFRDVKKMVFLK
jgi:subtilisin family serine protease